MADFKDSFADGSFESLEAVTNASQAMKARDEPSLRASCSRSLERDIEEFGGGSRCSSWRSSKLPRRGN